MERGRRAPPRRRGGPDTAAAGTPGIRSALCRDALARGQELRNAGLRWTADAPGRGVPLATHGTLWRGLLAAGAQLSAGWGYSRCAHSLSGYHHPVAPP